MGWGANGSFVRKNPELLVSGLLPRKGPSLPRKLGWAPKHTSSPSCLQSKLVPPPHQCSAVPGLVLRPSLRSPKPDLPRVSLAETRTPLPSPLPAPRHRSLSQELFFYARRYLLTSCLRDCHPTPQSGDCTSTWETPIKRMPKWPQHLESVCWLVTVHGP